MTRSLGIVVPAFRPDVERLGRYVRAIDDRLAPETLRIELDDPDQAVVDALADLPATVNAVARRRGKGAAITAGFDALSTDVLAFADADGATPAESLSAVVTPVLDDEADLSVGSRRHPESDVGGHQGVVRRFLGDGFAWLARRMLDAQLYDYQCGAKALSAEFWEPVRGEIYEPGFAWDIELVALVAAHGGRVREVPISWEDQPGSTVDPVADTLRMFRGLAVARHRARAVQGSTIHRALREAVEEDVASVSDRVASDSAASNSVSSDSVSSDTEPGSGGSD
ncbi:glycosyltransferase [Haloparvum sp. AD34]